MSLSLSSEEIASFLSESNIARVATINPDNSPHVTPVWYLWENNQLYIVIGGGSVKARNIKQNKKMAVTIDSNTAPNRAVIIEGIALVEEKMDEEISTRICRKYLRDAILAEYLEYARANWQQILVRILPLKIISWDYSKDPFLNRVLYRHQ